LLNQPIRIIHRQVVACFCVGEQGFLPALGNTARTGRIHQSVVLTVIKKYFFRRGLCRAAKMTGGQQLC